MCSLTHAACPPQSVAGALFFWSYELLVFMVLLNFLLAIIVDAFSEVKEKTEETVGIHTELFMMARDKYRSVMGSFSPNYISDDKLGKLLKQWAGEDEKDAAAAVGDRLWVGGRRVGRRGCWLCCCLLREGVGWWV